MLWDLCSAGKGKEIPFSFSTHFLILCSKVARVQGCWIQISVKFSYCTQFIHWGVWVAVWLCLLGPWAPPQFPLQETFPISDGHTSACLLSFQEIPNCGIWRWGWEGIIWLGYTPPLPQFSWWQWFQFLCFSTVFLPKNNPWILVDVLLASLLTVNNGSQVRSKFLVRVIIQREAWTTLDMPRAQYHPRLYVFSLQKKHSHHH